MYCDIQIYYLRFQLYHPFIQYYCEFFSIQVAACH